MMGTKTSILLCCCFLLLLPSVANGQSPNSNGWQIPQIACAEGCTAKPRLDERGNLYIYVVHRQPSYREILYFIQHGTNQLVEYNIQQLYPDLNVRWDFIPYSDLKLLLFNPDVVNQFVWLDLQTGQAVPLNVNISGQVKECNISSFVTQDPSFYRIGENGILFCSRIDAESYIHLAHLQNDTLVIENTFVMGLTVHAESQYLPPWRSIATSLNGDIYMVALPGRNEIIDQIAPEYAHLYDEAKYYVVLHYSQAAQTWDAIVIDASAERWISEGTNTFSPFVGADEAGNLYFLNSLINTVGAHNADLVKYNPQGEVLWHLTEADFEGQVFQDGLLLGEDEFILDFGRGNLQYETYH